MSLGQLVRKGWHLSAGRSKSSGCVQAEGEEEETDKLVEQVMLEVGIGADDGLVSAPQHQQAQQEAAPAQAEPQALGVDTDLEDRLNALRKS